jgi:hypothetical protein
MFTTMGSGVELHRRVREGGEREGRGEGGEGREGREGGRSEGGRGGKGEGVKEEKWKGE